MHGSALPQLKLGSPYSKLLDLACQAMGCGVRAHRTRFGPRRYVVFVKIGRRWLDIGAFYSQECAWAFAARLMQRFDGPDEVDVHLMS